MGGGGVTSGLHTLRGVQGCGAPSPPCRGPFMRVRSCTFSKYSQTSPFGLNGYQHRGGSTTGCRLRLLRRAAASGAAGTAPPACSGPAAKGAATQAGPSGAHGLYEARASRGSWQQALGCCLRRPPPPHSSEPADPWLTSLPTRLPAAQSHKSPDGGQGVHCHSIPLILPGTITHTNWASRCSAWLERGERERCGAARCTQPWPRAPAASYWS